MELNTEKEYIVPLISFKEHKKLEKPIIDFLKVIKNKKQLYYKKIGGAK